LVSILALVRDSWADVLRAHVLGCRLGASAFYLFILITSNPFLRDRHPPIEGRDSPVLQDIGLRCIAECLSRLCRILDFVSFASQP